MVTRWNWRYPGGVGYCVLAVPATAPAQFWVGHGSGVALVVPGTTTNNIASLAMRVDALAYDEGRGQLWAGGTQLWRLAGSSWVQQPTLGGTILALHWSSATQSLWVGTDQGLQIVQQADVQVFISRDMFLQQRASLGAVHSLLRTWGLRGYNVDMDQDVHLALNRSAARVIWMHESLSGVGGAANMPGYSTPTFVADEETAPLFSLCSNVGSTASQNELLTLTNVTHPITQGLSLGPLNTTRSRYFCTALTAGTPLAQLSGQPTLIVGDRVVLFYSEAFVDFWRPDTIELARRSVAWLFTQGAPVTLTTLTTPATTPTPTTPAATAPAVVMGQVTVQGNATVSSLAVGTGAQLIVLGEASIQSGAQLNISVDEPGTYTVLSYNSVSGAFGDVVANVASKLDCQDVLVSPAYGASSLTVSVTLDDTRCAETLSVPAIAGIAVGCFLLAALAIVLMAWLVRRKNQAVAEAHAKSMTLQQLK